MDLVFDIMGGVKVNLGIGKALQYKIADMRKLIGASSSDDPSAVAKAVSAFPFKVVASVALGTTVVPFSIFVT